MPRRRDEPAPDELRDAKRAATWARDAGFKLRQSWRWHCDAWPDGAVSYTTWRRYWHAA